MHSVVNTVLVLAVFVGLLMLIGRAAAYWGIEPPSLPRDEWDWWKG